MPVITALQAGHQNVCAFLDAIAGPGVEGTANDPMTRDNGYDILCGGVPLYRVSGNAHQDIPAGLVESKLVGNVTHSRFTKYDDHPAVMVQVTPKLMSTAAGRYQQMLKWWPAYRKQLSLTDFGPLAQDRLAIQLLKEQRAYQLLLQGYVAAAVAKCSNIWASLPGAGYNQHEASLDHFVGLYKAAGGVVA